MYRLTRIKLDPTKQKTIAAMENPNIIHGALMKACGEHVKDNAHHPLWRIDEIKRELYLLVLHEGEIDSRILTEQFAYNNAVEDLNYDDFLNNIKNGSVWRFRLLGSPTVQRAGNHKRVVLYGSDQISWLEKKGNIHGFLVDSNAIQITGSGWIDFQKKNKHKDRVRVFGVTYEGVLTVTNAELFRKSLVHGIGRGRAYGLGMLNIIPL